jgi:hypothetical protein
MSFVSITDVFCAVFSIVTLAAVCILPIATLVILLIFFNRLNDPYCIEKFGSLYLGLKTNSKPALLFHVIFTLRRLLLCLNAMFLSEWPFAQIQLNIYSTILVIIYITLVKPFDSLAQNQLEVFNEICILGVGQLLFVFTDYLDDD